jgi:CHAD domain-containing protein
VRNGFREFLLDDAEARLDELVAAATGRRGTISWVNGSGVRTCRRTWLDTFDWRLYRAGLALEQTTGRDGVHLTLTGRDGELLAAERIADGDGTPRWPGKLDALPPGPLRERLEPVVGVRALLPVARATSRMTEQRAVNADDKTIAKLGVDRMSVTFPARGVASPRLTLSPVRGYQAQADRLGAALAAVPGISAGSGSGLDAALTAAGQRPSGPAPKAGHVELRPDMPAGRAMASILDALLDVIELNVPGTVRDIDTEFLHDLRVAVRWTRSALKLAGDVLPAGLAGKFAPEFRWLGDLTTPARDLDVYELGFPAMTAGLVAATDDDLEPFRDYLDRARELAHRDLVRGLRSARFRRLATQWRAELAAAARVRKGPSVAQLADERITAANRKVLRTGHRITSAAPAESLHALRKRCKELRYLIEMFGSLHDPAARWQAVRELKALQDCLGEFQDAQVQREEIGVFAAQMLAARSAPAPTLLAMGEIAAGLARRQLRARREFDGRFASFAGAASQARLSVLARAAAA